MRKHGLFLGVLVLCLACCQACRTSRVAEHDAPATAGMQKSVSILGDSYSTFEGYVTPDTNALWYRLPPRHEKKNDVRRVEETWWYQLIDTLGWKLECNNSYSGSTVCHTGYRKEDYSDRSFVTRMTELGQPDVILVFGATNDSWAGAPIGEYQYADWTKQDLYSFRPAMACLLDGLRRLYSSAEVCFILNTELKAEVNESVHAICHHYGVQCIDLNDIDKQRGHPSVAGMHAIARQVAEGLRLGAGK